MPIEIVPAFTDNYIFVLRVDQQAMVVDPGDAEVVQAYLKQNKLTLTAILQTHHHWDHTGGTAELKAAYPECAVYTPFFDKGRYPVSTHMLKEGDQVAFGGWNFFVMRTPGHTFDHISYYDVQQKVLFCGDTLFNIGCGRIFDGSYEQLFLSLQKIKSLPDKVQVYCTHEYTLANIDFAKSLSSSESLQAYGQECRDLRQQGKFTVPFTLAENKQLNPFMQASTVEVLQAIREQKDRW